MARTTHRIAKKWAARISCRAVSLPMTLAHAKPSFWLLPLGDQRWCLRDQMTRHLGVKASIAAYVVRSWRPSC